MLYINTQKETAWQLKYTYLSLDKDKVKQWGKMKSSGSSKLGKVA